MPKQFAIAFGTISVMLGMINALPAQAAQLQVSFTTESGGSGSFILNTDTPAESAEVPSFITEGGLGYLNAVSDFSFSSPSLNFDDLDADFGVFPQANFNDDILGEGFPDIPGIYTAVYAPTGCLYDPVNFCSLEFPIAYIGNLAELPVLSDNPNDYFGGFDIAQVDSSGAISSDRLTSFSVRPVPESDSIFGTFVFGLGSLGGLLLKRKISLNKL